MSLRRGTPSIIITGPQSSPFVKQEDSVTLSLLDSYTVSNRKNFNFLDTNLNAGDLNLAHKVKSKTPSQGGKESDWLAEYQKLWLEYITKKDHSLDGGQPDRAKMWSSIVSNHCLAPPINVSCYGEKFQITK